MHPLFTHLLAFTFALKTAEACVATSPGGTATTTAAPTACRSCTLDTVTHIMISEGTKEFTSDTIDTSGTCAVRTAVCDGFSADSGVIITFNRDQAGATPTGTGTVSATLVCNDAGEWTLEGETIVITEIECQSTP
ncbi:Protein CBG01910 [Caenorhabditis briggsae]|uniref:C6 domain-containing protein n=2 Tax=Caenorhabditis briggsae TaxID=6238 RepID=A0AAE8ZN43_CAEBR|nr:Protein CBG01910 [Caenorhabditis briggsae]ULT80383.1 hypothetical protein L3Y34_010745 [Caenorhabditis briggsae]CAP23109.1 Protein CBG01910 [Caenorhabditis briggsae]